MQERAQWIKQGDAQAPLLAAESFATRRIIGSLLQTGCRAAAQRFKNISTVPVRNGRAQIGARHCIVQPTRRDPRDAGARVSLAPLVNLMATKAQNTRAIFYLPAGGALQVESVVLFGAAATMPATAHAESKTVRYSSR